MRRSDGGLAMKLMFVGPAIFLLLAMNIFPLLYDVWLSFTNADLSGGDTQMVNGANYEILFSDDRYDQAIGTTAKFVLLAVGLELVLGFVLALAMKDKMPAKPVVLTLLLIPMMLCPVVLSLFWNLILNGNYGVLNQALAFVGLPQPQWLTDNDLKFLSVLLIDVWMWTPFMMLIALAGLSAIPKYIYEAAEIDGAGPWQRFMAVTLPGIRNTVIFVATITTFGAFRLFDVVFVLTRGGPLGSTNTVIMELYEVGYVRSLIGRSSAIAVVFFITVIAVTLMQRRILREEAS